MLLITTFVQFYLLWKYSEIRPFKYRNNPYYHKKNLILENTISNISLMNTQTSG